jgi:hypothetical protein
MALATSLFTHPPPQCNKPTPCHPLDQLEIVFKKCVQRSIPRHCTAFSVLSALYGSCRFPRSGTVGSISGLHMSINKPSTNLGWPGVSWTGTSRTTDPSPRQWGLYRPPEPLKSCGLFFGSEVDFRFAITEPIPRPVFWLVRTDLAI